MPRFDVTISASGIDLPSMEEPIIGFSATRRVRARDVQSAMQAARRLIVEEWQSGGYQARNRASAPVVEIEAVVRRPVFDALRQKPREGFFFFSQPC